MRERRGWKRLRWFLLLLLIEAAVTVVLAETVTRLFWTIKYDVPFFRMDKIYYSFYPELKVVEKQEILTDNDTYDILILGGSVLNRRWGDIERILYEKLCFCTKKKIATYNMAQPAHTSLDSYIKYKYLQDKHFDLVVVYHAINETRANNVPPTYFLKDYSHYSWYRDIRVFQSYRPVIRYFALPYTLHHIVIEIGNRFGLAGYVAKHTPNAAWLPYGSSIKTAVPFRENLEKISGLAESKKERLMLMSFAYYVPVDYSEAKFASKSLDYTTHLSPIGTWGTPANVVAGIEAHNAVIRKLASEHPEVIFIDQDRLLPKNGEYFNDICHLTYKGAEVFAGNMAGVIERLMPARK